MFTNQHLFRNSTAILGALKQCEIEVLVALVNHLRDIHGNQIHNWPDEHFSEFGIMNGESIHLSPQCCYYYIFSCFFCFLKVFLIFWNSSQHIYSLSSFKPWMIQYLASVVSPIGVKIRNVNMPYNKINLCSERLMHNNISNVKTTETGSQRKILLSTIKQMKLKHFQYWRLWMINHCLLMIAGLKGLELVKVGKRLVDHLTVPFINHVRPFAFNVSTCTKYWDFIYKKKHFSATWF